MELSNHGRLRPAAFALLIVASLVTAGPGTAAAEEETMNGTQIIAATPPMGWSSWSSLRGNVSEAVIKAQAKSMHDNLQSVGYTYINIDSGWTDHLDEYGRVTWNATKFPNGIRPVADYVHSLGLKFGLYLLPGIPKAAVDANLPIYGTPYHAQDIADTTAVGNTHGDAWRIDYSKPGAAEYVQSQVDMLASWGVDYVKMDFVGPGGGTVPADNRVDLEYWHKAILHNGRPIHLELSNSLSFADVSTWQAYSNGWRIEGDIECYSHCPDLTNWDQRVARRWTDVPKWVPYAGPGHWNDLDSVEVGNGSHNGLSPDERQSVLTLWSISASPLLLGTDLTKLDDYDLTLLKNTEVIGVDQAGHPAHPVSQATPQQVWFSDPGDSGDGSYTVALFNLDTTAATVTANWSDLGFSGHALVHDMWSHENLGKYDDGFTATVPPHGSRLLRVVPLGLG
jgi:alpha-galactosidase